MRRNDARGSLARRGQGLYVRASRAAASLRAFPFFVVNIHHKEREETRMSAKASKAAADSGERKAEKVESA